MVTPGVPTSVNLIESALEQATQRLSTATPGARVTALRIEVRRLRSVVANWRAVPPTPAARREILAQVSRLTRDDVYTYL